MTPTSSHPGPQADPMTAHVDAERSGWYELAELVRSLTPEECVTPGYYRGPDWAIRDLVAHLGTWLAEAQVQFERMHAGTYEVHDVDVDALNARLLAAMAGQPWDVAWVQANAGRTRMLDEWSDLHEASDEVTWWIQKSGGDHYADHLARLREWAAELIERRAPGALPER